MANRYFANLGDIWKHLVLAEVPALEHPRQFVETHAGTATYPLTPSPAREFGVYRFMDNVRPFPALASSRYAALLDDLPRKDGYPATTTHPAGGPGRGTSCLPRSGTAHDRGGAAIS